LQDLRSLPLDSTVNQIADLDHAPGKLPHGIRHVRRILKRILARLSFDHIVFIDLESLFEQGWLELLVGVRIAVLTRNPVLRSVTTIATFSLYLRTSISTVSELKKFSRGDWKKDAKKSVGSRLSIFVHGQHFFSCFVTHSVVLLYWLSSESSSRVSMGTMP
jgi:hypothetical protein